MLSTRFKVSVRAICALLLGVIATLPQHVRAQDPNSITSSEISISDAVAEARLELTGERQIDAMVRNGRAYINGRDVASAPQGGELDRAWRDLLNRAMDAPTNDLSKLFKEWKPPTDSDGERLQAALETALNGKDVTAVTSSTDPASLPGDAIGSTNDSVNKLNARIAELEREVTAKADRERDASAWTRPFRPIFRGIADIVAALTVYAVLFGIGFAVVFFGRRKNLEIVAETARRATLRSGMVGLAASFLVLPVFVLGAIVLAISIIGIPALLAWIPLFPVACIAAVTLGYLAVAHAAGESFAERRFSGADWYTRGNSYYFLLTGLGLLMALFLASHVVEMAGPWLGFIRGTLLFFAIVLTWAAATVGFGAVLLTRAGTRPMLISLHSDADTGDIYAESAHV